jgi:F420-non-reducing hydrogenase small subunit
MDKNKLKIAFYWAASCGGCEIAVLDINEKILDVVQIADIVFWPVAIDVKYKDAENMPDKYIDITFFNGLTQGSNRVVEFRNLQDSFSHLGLGLGNNSIRIDV